MKTTWEVEREQEGESASITSLMPKSPVGIESVQDAERLCFTASFL